ncbi:PREDICTED: nucleolar protein 14 [Nelumbo nucifera]|uniref:Nucleolar protein 14 n=2 Tax=Nelumbo nucifera TaxID=4432 RepID=A0A822YJ42_NELNU|nr:PREDICTED: nucleolar protein 14 [Nelumbo nucifera]DAD31531.1 TPA_asm: hypothetical protein HUJ06_010382 [Nelumbo nucifera]
MAKKKAESNPKSSTSGTKKKKKNSLKKLLSGPNAMAMKSKPANENPFETIWSRRKFDILGKKRKGEEKRVGLARSRAIEKRKKTLLKEYEQSGKSSVFLDKRIGEQNDALGEFDKAILRSQHERKLKLRKSSKYNLSDGEEDDFAVNGGGYFGRDDFEDEMLPDDDNDAPETQKNPAILKHLNTPNIPDQLEAGSTEGGENKHKSKKEVMEEIILKSKFFKAEKAKEKEKNVELMERLDKDFMSLMQSQAFLSMDLPSKKDPSEVILNKSNLDPVRKEISATSNKVFPNQVQPDAYDKFVNQMVLDMRARPSDRTKTDEEIAQEEKERLERLEEERKKRMLATDDSDDEGSDGHEDTDKEYDHKLRPISGDDLGDSFSFHEEPKNRRGWVDEVLERKDVDDSASEASSEDSGSDEDDSDEEGSDKNNSESGKSHSLKDWEQSDEDNLSTDIEEEEEEEEEGEEDKEGKGLHKVDNNMQEIKNKKADPLDAEKTKSSQKQHPIKQGELHYTIEAPTNLSDLCTLLDNRSDAEIVEAINRIRIYNAIKLAAENRKKMQVFYGVLLQYFAVLANKKPLNFKLLNLLVMPLIEMSAETPYFAAICARQRILRIRTQFCEDVKRQEKSCWPSLKTLLLLRLWSMIFPCSDFRHVVMTPAILLMCDYLMRCPILCGRDIAVGSFLCSMVLSVVKQSQKFCPEAIIFLKTLLMSASDAKLGSCHHSQLYYLVELKMLTPWLRLHDHVSEIHTLDFLDVMDMPEDSSFFSSDDFRVGVLVSVVETLRGFVHIYDGLASFPEIFMPVSTLLYGVAKQEFLPDVLQENFGNVAELIKNKANEHQMLRQPLQMRKQKPVPNKQLTPKFEENFVKGRDYDPDRERAERKKLKKLLKREAKGAARELRKDNYFLSEVKEKERAILEEERAEKYGKAWNFLQEQEHAFKSGQLGKGRKRRR